RQVLSRLISQILPRDSDILVIASDNPKRPGMEQLLRVRAAMECRGACECRNDMSKTESQGCSVDSAFLHSVLYFDATNHRRDDLSEKSPQAKTGAQAGVNSVSPPKDQMESFLV